MQCPPCAHPDSIRYGTSRVVSLPTDLSDAPAWQRSSPQATGLSTLFRRDGDASYWPDSRSPSHDSLSLAAASRPSTPRKLTTDRSLPAPSVKLMNSALSSLKKISMLALASGGLHLWQGPRLCLWEKDDQNW